MKIPCGSLKRSSKRKKPISKNCHPFWRRRYDSGYSIFKRKKFIHAHGVKLGNEPEGHGINRIRGIVNDSPGPEIVVHIRFPSSGIYKIFNEMKHEGKIILLEFMIKAEK